MLDGFRYLLAVLWDVDAEDITVEKGEDCDDDTDT